ncbi:MAG: hypothetical protein ABI807_10685 [Sporichthyaceae bacterium]
MLLNVVAPTGLDSPRGALFNLDWVTLTVMVVIALVGLVAFLVVRPGSTVGTHLQDALVPGGAETGGARLPHQGSGPDAASTERPSRRDKSGTAVTDARPGAGQGRRPAGQGYLTRKVARPGS